jgi:hypothetical protein
MLLSSAGLLGLLCSCALLQLGAGREPPDQSFLSGSSEPGPKPPVATGYQIENQPEWLQCQTDKEACTSLVLGGRLLTGSIPIAIGALSALTELVRGALSALTESVIHTRGAVRCFFWCCLRSSEACLPSRAHALPALALARTQVLDDNMLTGGIPDALGACTLLSNL